MGDRTVDMSRSIEYLEELESLQEKLNGLDGSPIDASDNRRKRPAADQAEHSRLLLYAAHVSRQLTLELEHQYFRFKGTIPA